MSDDYDTSYSSYETDDSDEINGLDEINNAKTTQKNYKQIIHDMIYDFGLSDHISVDDLFKKTQVCKNYVSKCEVYSPCCNKYYCCCKCHDSNEDHYIERNKIIQLRCINCKKEQEVSNVCVICGTTFGDYVCLLCMVFDASEKEIVHCDKCNVCWIVRNDDPLIHCDRCKCCMPSNLYKDHKCIDDKLNNCPICFDSLKTVKEVQIMDCGHAIHTECFNEYIKHCYKCPTCKKTVVDMVEKFKEYDKEIYETPIPSELRTNVDVYCNDCQKSNNVPFHYIGIKCTNCGSYNTQKK